MLGRQFIQDPTNRAKLSEIAKKALNTQNATNEDKIELNKMIKILDNPPPKKQ